jgi:hypothetical protein
MLSLDDARSIISRRPDTPLLKNRDTYLITQGSWQLYELEALCAIVRHSLGDRAIGAEQYLNMIEGLKTRMPLEMEPNREAFEAVGFTFGDTVDKLFVFASPPTGWTHRVSNSATMNEIFDQKGRRRCMIFSDPTDKEPEPHATLIPRFTIMGVHENGGRAIRGVWGIYDAGREVMCFGAGVRSLRHKDFERYHRECFKAMEDAQNWLEEHRPDYKDPLAYWDDAPIA